MFRASRRVTTHIPTAALLSDTTPYIQVVNLIHISTFSRRYSTQKKNKITASYVVDKIIVKMQVLKQLKNLKSISHFLEFSKQDADCERRFLAGFPNYLITYLVHVLQAASKGRLHET